MSLQWWCGYIYYALFGVCMLHCSTVLYCRTVQHADYLNNCNFSKYKLILSVMVV